MHAVLLPPAASVGLPRTYPTPAGVTQAVTVSLAGISNLYLQPASSGVAITGRHAAACGGTAPVRKMRLLTTGCLPSHASPPSSCLQVLWHQ